VDIKTNSQWEDYPNEPLDAGFINYKIIRVHPELPLNGYTWTVSSPYLYYFTQQELARRLKDHPEAEALLAYASATDTDPRSLEFKRALAAPKGYCAPEKNESWLKFEEIMRGRLKPLAWKYRGASPLISETSDGNILYESYVSAQEGLMKGADYWKDRDSILAAIEDEQDPMKGADYWKKWGERDFIIAALEDRLFPSLLKIVKNDLIDATRKSKPLSKKIADNYQEKLENERADKGILKQEGEVYVSEQEALKHLYHQPDVGYADKTTLIEEDEEIPSLDSLNLDFESLSPREQWVVKDVYQGLQEGYSFNSKQERSFIQRWGKDYTRNIKTFNRAKPKLKRPK